MIENDSASGNKGPLQEVLDKFKATTKEVADKVEDTVEDVKNSEFGEKVANAAKNVGEKAKDMIQDVKESEFADKVGDIAENVASKAKGVVGTIIGKLGRMAGLNTLIEAANKFQASPEDTTRQENQLDELDKFVAAIIEDGVITPEEEAKLAKKAEELGINVEDFLAEVREKLAAKRA